MNLLRNAIKYLRLDHIRHNCVSDSFEFLPRPFASIAYLVSGGWDFREFRHGEDDSSGTAKAGDILYVPMGSTYNSVWRGNAYAISIHFELSEIGIFGTKKSSVQAIKHENFLSAGGSGFDPEREFFAVSDLLTAAETSPTWKFAVMSKLYRLLEATVPCLEIRNNSPDDAIILPALDHLRENFNRPCAVPELARLCNLSDSQFFLRFKRATGVTPVEYKNRLMISNAERLLLDEPETPIEEVAERMGFSSSTYFRRIFKRMSSKSPREFRKDERNIL